MVPRNRGWSLKWLDTGDLASIPWEGPGHRPGPPGDARATREAEAMGEPRNVAVFLGAGASKAFGLPLTNEILPRITQGIEQGTLLGSGEGAERCRKNIRDFLGRVLPGYREETAGFTPITEVLSLIDYLIVSTFVPFRNFSIDYLTELRSDLERAILSVLEWPYDPIDEHQIPGRLKTFGDWLFQIGQSGRCSLISTNYDELVETELNRRILKSVDPATTDPEFLRNFHDRRGAGYASLTGHVIDKIDFGLSWKDSPSGQFCHPCPRAPYGMFKLHGSVNWLKCELCNWISCNDEYIFNRKYYKDISTILDHPDNRCSCGHSPLRQVMVAPSTVRDIRDVNLLSVWKAAFEAMRTSEEWYVVGYSMPIEDVSIRSMLLRAYAARDREPRVVVVQRGENETTYARYQSYFPKCEYIRGGLEQFIDESCR
jgi:hypothetical protein